MDRRATTRVLLAAAVTAAAFGCAAPRAPKPPAVAATPAVTIADPQVGTLLVRSCFGCHANEARLPWYGYLAPSSWTNDARTDLNFSDWPIYDAARKREALDAIAMTVQVGTMPPRDYTFFNRGAALREHERDALLRWASRDDAPVPAQEDASRAIAHTE